MNDHELAEFVKASILLHRIGQNEQWRRNIQSKLAKQSAEIKRLSDENQKLRLLANSRGDLIRDIMARAAAKQACEGK